MALVRLDPRVAHHLAPALRIGTHELRKLFGRIRREALPFSVHAAGDFGQAQLTFATLPTVIPHVRAGKLRGVAVIGATRSAAAPQIPTIAESGVPGFAVNNWIGLFAPAGTPPEIVRKVNAEVMRIMRLPEIARRMEVEGVRFTLNTPEVVAQFIRADTERWSKVVREAGIKAD